MASVPQFGVQRDIANSRVSLNYAGTRRVTIDASGAAVTGTLSSGALAVTGAATVSTTLVVTGLVTASAALTVTTGNLTTTAGDNRVTAGNLRLGAVAAFGTTEPTSWVVFKSGTQPAGAITTSGGVGSDDTTVQKIIAAGTINNVET
jgi:hypothetical protein